MRTLAVVHMKGGVGKTTTAVHLAAAWAHGKHTSHHLPALARHHGHREDRGVHQCR